MGRSRFLIYLLIVIAFPLTSHAQSEKKMLDHDAYDIWQRINEPEIANSGEWILYSMGPEYGDALLQVKHVNSEQVFSIPRGVSAAFTVDSRHVVTHIKPQADSVRQAKLDDVKKEDMPKDSLAILDLATGAVTYVSRIKSYKLPEEAGGWVAYLLEKPVENKEAKEEEMSEEESEEKESEETEVEKTEEEKARDEKRLIWK